MSREDSRTRGGLGDEDSGLAPVVGVALLVGITLLLAASVATVVIGVGDQSRRSDTPATAFRFDYDATTGGPDTLRITHTGGDPVPIRQLYVDIEGATCAGGTGDPNGRYEVHRSWGYGSAIERMQAGFSFAVGPRRPTDPMCSAGSLDLDAAVVRLVWQPPSGNGVVLREWSSQ